MTDMSISLPFFTVQQLTSFVHRGEQGWTQLISCPLQVAGKKENVSGVALLIPELNAADLTEQGGARELLRQFAEVRSNTG